MAIVRCKEPFAAWVNGVPWVFNADKLFDDRDPAYTGLSAEQREAFFEPVETYMSRRAPVEQTTAAPGEVRTVTTARRSKK